jgi:hypothetical protein
MSKAVARTLADFRSVHDRNVVVPNKIKAALAAMLKEGPEHYEYESDLMKRAQISQTDLGEFRDQFAEHIVIAPAVHGKTARRVWFASPKVAAKARGDT